MRMAQRPQPIVTDETDAIVHVTSTTICGSDLHMCMKSTIIYFSIKEHFLFFNSDTGDMKGMKSKDIIGHECKSRQMLISTI